MPAATHATLPVPSCTSQVSIAEQPHCGTSPHLLLGAVVVQLEPESGGGAASPVGVTGPVDDGGGGGGVAGGVDVSVPAGVAVSFDVPSSKDPRELDDEHATRTANAARTSKRERITRNVLPAALHKEIAETSVGRRSEG